ncbi:MAG: multidrug effflux MFS transporter [Rhizobiales bacterium]|nr:multidrug effflux MFS transporter [Hyphomicrobiales bacterium]MBI3672280.1 multidrug effflux MFS transporter [Hyphomicrobiales bacterium]
MRGGQGGRAIVRRAPLGYPPAVRTLAPQRRLALAEFVPLMAMITALDALSIDSLLPALPALGRDLGVTGANDAQLVVSAMFLGMAFGQIGGGPASDSFGRRPLIVWGLALFAVGSLIGMAAWNFPVMLAARLLQGFGASIPVVVMTALVRDLYEGAPMARIYSFIGGVFILVPILAPLAGQGILLVAGWRMVFLLYLALAGMAVAWFILRQPETLARDRRHPFSLSRISLATLEVLRHPVALGYILAGGFLFGPFLGYLSSAQQIFQTAYGAGVYFVLLFSSLAFSIGVALFVNGALVERFGMQRLTYLGLGGLAGAAILFLPVVLSFGGVPPLWLTMTYLVVSFLCVGILFGNLNALAMEPLGHIAGVGAAAVGFSQTVIGLPIGTFIGQAFDGTVIPLVSGFAVFATLSLVAMRWTEARRPVSLTAAGR